MDIKPVEINTMEINAVEIKTAEIHTVKPRAAKAWSRGTIAGLRRAALALAVVLTLLLAPTAAYAAFTGNVQSQLGVSAAKLVAPAEAATHVNKSCGVGNYWGSANIMVASYGLVAGANYYELRVLDPRGALAFTGDLASSAGKQYSFFGWSANIRGTWTYEIRGYYKVPGTTNSWAGAPLSGTVVCS